MSATLRERLQALEQEMRDSSGDAIDSVWWADRIAALLAAPEAETRIDVDHLRALATLWWDHDSDTDELATLFAERPIEWLVKFGGEVLRYGTASAPEPPP